MVAQFVLLVITVSEVRKLYAQLVQFAGKKWQLQMLFQV